MSAEKFLTAKILGKMYWKLSLDLKDHNKI